MKKGLYVCKNHFEGGTEYKLLATKRFKENLRFAGWLLLGVAVALLLIWRW